MFSIAVYYGAHLSFVYLPDETSGEKHMVLPSSLTGWKQDCHVRFYAIDGLWRVACPEGMSWKTTNPKPLDRAISDGFNMSAVGDTGALGIYCRAMTIEDTVMSKYVTRQRISIGRTDSDITIDDKFISDRHGEIIQESGKWKYGDHSKNGSYINGVRVIQQKTDLQIGDVISYACGVRIAFYGDVLAIGCGTSARSVSLERMNVVDYPRTGYNSADAYTLVSRPPHFFHAIKETSYQMEPVPVRDTTNRQPLILTIGPSLTMSLPMLMGSFLAGTGGYAKSGVIMMVTSSALAVTWTLVNHFYAKHTAEKIYSEQMDDYIERLGNFEHDVEQEMKNIADEMLKMFPSGSECFSFVRVHSDHIWQNDRETMNFLMARLGTGMGKLPCTIEVPKLKMGEHPRDTEEAPYKAAERLNKLYPIPICLPFNAGVPVGIICPQGSTNLVQSIILQIATLNSYVDCRIAVIAREGSEERWRVIRNIPHAIYEKHPTHHMIACSNEAKYNLLNDLYDLLKYRAEQGDDQQGGIFFPRYIVFCDDMSALQESAFFRLAMQRDFGFTVCAIGSSVSNLPKECGFIVDAMNPSKGLLYDRQKGTVAEYKPEILSKEEWIQGFRAMAPLRDNEYAVNGGISDRVGFLEAFGVQAVEDMAIWRNWNSNSVSSGIRALIGFKSGNQPFVLDLSDKAHGPHGIVAGTTGSGKSVFLQTLVLSLAVRYSPTELQFILIDYKGGGAFACFEGLPHVVGLIDNLNGRKTILRALASVNGEVKRREAIFKDAGVNDINDYIRMFNPNPDFPPLSHIVIIIDEFAELKEEMPDFIDEVVSVARIGRSVGIHLILATQKPSASVSGEIWSNSRFHICLRVQTREDSMEMLHRPDAAYIKGMGSGFVQVGNDELFEQIQSSYSGFPYTPDTRPDSEQPFLLDDSGIAVHIPRKESAHKDPQKTQMDVLLQSIAQIMAEHNRDAGQTKIRTRGQLWLDEIPAVLPPDRAEAMLSNASGIQFPSSLWVPFGMLDDIDSQRQRTAGFSFSEHPIVAVIGRASSGKTAFLQTVIHSICRHYSPDEMQVCIASFNGAQLEEMLAYPNVISYCRASEQASLRQMLCLLRQLVDTRQKMFDTCKVSGFQGYEEARCEDASMPGMPGVVVVIDRIGQLLGMLSDNEQDQLVDFIKTAAGYGVFFCFSAIEKAEMPYGGLRDSVYAVPLCQKTLSDYSMLLDDYRFPPNTQTPASVPGRGMIKTEGRVFEFHGALAFGEPKDPVRNKQLIQDGLTLAQGRAVRPAISVTHVPSPLDAEALRKIAESSPEAAGMPVGLKKPDLSPICVDLFRNPCLFIYGKHGTGATFLLKSCARSRMRVSGSKLFILCASNEWDSFAQEEGVYCLNTQIASDEKWEMWLTAFKGELMTRNRQRKACDGWENASREREIAESFFPMTLVFDDTANWYGTMELPESFVSFLNTVFENGRKYNIAVFSSCATGSSYSLPTEEITALKNISIGIALANTLESSDPWSVDISCISGNQPKRPGEGYIIQNQRTTSAVLPGQRR